MKSSIDTLLMGTLSSETGMEVTLLNSNTKKKKTTTALLEIERERFDLI
jgi:hypothetical protein